MSPDRKLLQNLRAKDARGYVTVREAIRIGAPIIVLLLIAITLMEAYDFYQYSRFDDASHKVNGLVVNEVIGVAALLVVARLWFLVLEKK